MFDLDEQLDAASNELRNQLTTVAFAPASTVFQRLHRRRRLAPVAALMVAASVVAVAVVTTRDNAMLAPASTPSAQNSSVGPTTSVTTTAATSTPVALVVGDSLDLQVHDELVAAGFLVDADINRQATPETVLGVIQPLRDNGTLPKVVIVHLGSNAPATAEEFDSVAQLLADRQLVIFVTVHVNASWAPQNNEHIQRLPSRYPNVKIADWAAQVDAGNVPGGIAPDGFHLLTAEARQFYAELLVGAIKPTTTDAQVSIAPAPVANEALTIRMEFPTDEVAGNAVVEGSLVVNNHTGSPVSILDDGCAPKWDVVLANKSVPATAVFAMDCLTQPLVLPVGESRLTVRLSAQYRTCTASVDGPHPLCIGDPSHAPPLPEGSYLATFVGRIPGLLPPAAVPMHVTAAGS